MADLPYPWRRPERLAALARDWDRRLSGRRVDRLGGGDTWMRLTLIDAREDDAPPAHCFLTARPGAALCWDADRSPAPAVLDALDRQRQRDLWCTPHLLGAILVRVGVLPEDLVLAMELRAADGRPLHMLLQLFGPRGNLALIDDVGRRLWSAHPSPHPVLLDPPRRFAPAIDDPEVADEFRTEAPAHLIITLVEETRRRLATDLDRARTAAARLRDNLAADLDSAEGGDRWRHLGETLAIHLHALKPGMEEAVLTDAEGVEQTIPLDPAKPPHANMEECFKRARKAERGLETIAARLEEAEERLAALDDAASGLEAQTGDDAGTLSALADWRTAHAELLPARGGRGERIPLAPRESRPFRRYRIDGRWDVWVGRDNQENDELTHRASRPDDWWFHAQGVPGSHVILRAEGKPDQVPKSVLEKAAAVAAWHSKARTSGLAPVMVTLRKYVRKPRKSAAGAALPSREKTLMVEPGLPEVLEE